MALGYSNGMVNVLANRKDGTPGSVGDGVTDDTTALQAALTAADALYFPPDTKYLITSPLTKTNGGVIIIGNGSSIITNGDFDTVAAVGIEVPLDVDGDSVVAVTSVSTGELPNSIAAASTRVTRVEVADASLYARGRKICLYSSDQIPQSGSANNEYIGERSTVIYVDEVNDYVYLDYVLHHLNLYSTSIRMSMLGEDIVKIDDLFIEAHSGQAESANTKGIMISNTVASSVNNTHYTDIDDDALTFWGCYAPSSDLTLISGARTDAGDSATGYGVFEISCSFGKHTRIDGRACRSAYQADTKTPSNVATAKQKYFGETISSHISDSTGMTFGFHAGTRNCICKSCNTQEGNYRTPDTGILRGFSSRGVNNKFIDCFGKASCLHAYNEAGATEGFSVTIDGGNISALPLVADDVTLRTPACSFAGESGVNGKVTMINTDTRGIYTTAVQGEFVDIEMYNPVLRYARDVASTYASNMFTINEGCTVKLYNPVYDTREHLGTGSLYLFDINHATGSFESYGGTWIGADGAGASSVRFGSLSTLDATAIIKGLKTDAAVSALTSIGAGATTEVDHLPPGSNYTVSTTWNPASIADGASLSSSGITVTGAAFGDSVEVAAPYSLQGIQATAYVSAANTVIIRLRNNTGGAINLGSGSWKVRTHRLN